MDKLVNRSFYVFPTCVEEVDKVIKGFSSNRASRIDDTYALLLKSVSDIVDPVLFFIIGLLLWYISWVVKTAVVIHLKKAILLI